MKVVISGASGLLGATLVRALQNQWDVVALYHRHGVVARPGTSHQIDLTDEHATRLLLKEVQADWVIHSAALTNVDYCESHPDEAYRSNVIITQNVVQASKSVGSSLVYISTDSVFDGRRGNYCEEDPLNPINVYAQTKRKGEEVVRALMPASLIIRTNFYGWNAQEKDSMAERMLYSLKCGEKVKGFSDIIFSPLLVNDLSEILSRMIQAGLSGVYHVAAQDSCSKFEFSRMLASIFDFNPDRVESVSHEEVSLDAHRPLNTSLCVEKVRQALAIPMPTVMSGLKRFKVLLDEGYVEQLKGIISSR